MFEDLELFAVLVFLFRLFFSLSQEWRHSKSQSTMCWPWPSCQQVSNQYLFTIISTRHGVKMDGTRRRNENLYNEKRNIWQWWMGVGQREVMERVQNKLSRESVRHQASKPAQAIHIIAHRLQIQPETPTRFRSSTWTNIGSSSQTNSFSDLPWTTHQELNR